MSGVAVTAVERVLDIFEAFQRSQKPLSLTDLADIAGIPKSSCHAIVATLTDVWAVSAFLTVNTETLAVAIAGPRHRMENSVAECAQLLLATCSFISRQWSRS